MNKEQVHTLVIPDVHGRTFWKDAIKEFPIEDFPNLVIVFLGDYVDPYDFENISREFAIDNLMEIIELAKKDSRIHLLIGNHDMHYWYDARGYKCRVDHNNYYKIQKIFINNLSLFNIAYEEIIDDVRYLYTHAGVTSFWLNHLKRIGGICLENIDKGKLKEERKSFSNLLVNIVPTANELNNFKGDFQGDALLWEASWIRGGDNDCGSCIWADFEEWMYDNSSPLNKTWQIFGHSLAANGFDEGVIDYQKCIAMLDSRQAYVISNEGEIFKLKAIL